MPTAEKVLNVEREARRLAEPRAANPFTTAVPWEPEPPVAFQADESVFDQEPDPAVSESLRLTFRAFAAYADDEGVCWPSDDRVAQELGLWRETVTRHRLKLQEARWMRIIEKRWSKRSGWLHNVCELLAMDLCPVSDLARRRVTRRAHRRAHNRPSLNVIEGVRQVRQAVRRGLGFGDDHTKREQRVGARAGSCGCRSCRPDLGRFNGPSPLKLAKLKWRPRPADDLRGPVAWRNDLARALEAEGRDPFMADDLKSPLDDLPDGGPWPKRADL